MAASPGVMMARKKSTDKEPAREPAKRYGTLIRVSDDFAELLRKVCPLAGQSAADFVDENLLAIVQKRYRDLLKSESKKLGGKESD